MTAKQRLERDSYLVCYLRMKCLLYLLLFFFNGKNLTVSRHKNLACNSWIAAISKEHLRSKKVCNIQRDGIYTFL